MATLDDLSLAQLQALKAQKADPNISAINQIESGGAGMTANPVNPTSGASSNMQTMKATARDPGFGVTPSNGTPQDNSRTGTEYYGAMLKRYNDPTAAAIAYNWGPGNADKWIANGADIHKLPLETLKYIKKFKQLTKPVEGGDAPTQALSPGEQDVSAAPAPAQPAQEAPAPQGDPNSLWRQLGLTARAAGHGIADAAGVLGNPLNAAINAGGQAIGHNPHLQDVDTLLRGFVDKNTPTPNPGVESTVNDVAGAVANPINMAMGGVAPTGVTRAIAMGMAGGANQPVHENTDMGDYARNVALGGAFGGALGVGAKAIGGIRPRANAQALIDEGVTPTPGQVAGGWVKTVEDRASSVPLVGDAVKSGQQSAIKDLNRAAYQRVLDPIGEKAPTEVGRDAVESISDRLSDRYNDILPKVTFTADKQFMNDLAPVAQTVSSLPADLQNRFAHLMDRNFFGQLQSGSMPGEAMKKTMSEITKDAKNLSSSSSAFERDLGGALNDVNAAIRANITRTNPTHAAELNSIDKAYGRFSILRDAASRVNNPEAPISAGQLQGAVKAADKTVGKGNYAKGNARMQDLSDPGVAVLGSNYPDSGTAGRMMLGSGLMGALGAMNPLTMIGGAGVAGLYGTQAGRKAMLAALTRRPEFARVLAGEMPRAAYPVGQALVQGQAQKK